MSNMFVIDVERKEVTKECPIINDWLIKMKKIKINEG